MTPFGKKKHILKKKKHKAYNFKKVRKKNTLEELNPMNYLLAAKNLVRLKGLTKLSDFSAKGFM